MTDRFVRDIQASRFVGSMVRLRTLTTIRWVTIGGQGAAIFFVYFVLGFSFPFVACLALLAASIWVNLYATLRYEPTISLPPHEVAGYLVFDSVQMAGMLFLTGGLLNPFSILLLVPSIVAIGVLPSRFALPLVGLVFALITFVAMVHYPLPWRAGENIDLPPLYDFGVWASLVLTMGFSGFYMRRISKGNGRMTAALTATQLVLAREERLLALGGLAAAAAHELGSPLSTIQVTAKEMQRELKEGELAEDAALLVSQAVRCREILTRLSADAEAGVAARGTFSLRDLLNEAAAPCLTEGRVAILYIFPGGDDVQDIDGLIRRPELVYGLRNLIENAARHAQEAVTIEADWTETDVTVSILDDGPGFSRDMLLRLGEPYVGTTRNRRWDLIKGRRTEPANAGHGMGLGFFIAKTLLTRTGAQIAHGNRPRRQEEQTQGSTSGAWVRISWPLTNLKLKPVI